jgi:HPr kinase/phosphorylase
MAAAVVPMADASNWPPSKLPAVVHGTAVAISGRSVLLRGASGRGKSSTALQMMGMGARLISDDLVSLDASETGIRLSRPPQVRGPAMIEARGIGLLRVATASAGELVLVVDLDHDETERLPQPVHVSVAGHSVRQLRRVENPAFPSMLLQYLSAGVGTE